MIFYRRYGNGIFRFLFFCIYLCTVISTQVSAHNKDSHDDREIQNNSEAGSVQQFAIETLRIPNVPVIDTAYHTEGFVSRFINAKTVVISLTYTGCETLCPITNVILQQLDRAIHDNNLTSIHIVTLSIDPQNDTPDAMRASADLLESSERWTWLTATPQHGRMLMRSFDVDVTVLEEHDPMFLVGNIATGRFIRVIGIPDPEQLIAISRSNFL